MTTATKSKTRKKEAPTTEELRAEETALRKKYPEQSIVKDSIANIGDAKDLAGRTVPKKFRGWKKRTVLVRCQWKGCDEERRIATSDLKQVRYCEEHTEQHRKQRRREMRRKKAKLKAK